MTPHIALIPSAGMGHLNPFCRLASKLLSLQCKVTLIMGRPIFTAAEETLLSSFLRKHPQVRHLEYQILPPEDVPGIDPFFLQYGAIGKSTHLAFAEVMSSSPPFTTVVCDIFMANTVPRFASQIGVPCYIFITTSFRFLSFMAYLPTLISDPEKRDADSSHLEIPGLGAFDRMSIPRLFMTPGHYITELTVSLAVGFTDATGLIVNSFESLEEETFSALNQKKIVSLLPPSYPVGPLEEYDLETGDRAPYMDWLDTQPKESIIYANFGSRSAMSIEQIRELGHGLERSKFKFLWIIKTSKIDSEEKESLGNVLGESYLERIKNQGLILKEWVAQPEVLSHPSVGGFLSHCGWNSAMEAARAGVPVLGWPLHGDQRTNAEVLEKAGLGLMERSWKFGMQKFVAADEIAAAITKLMLDCDLRKKAKVIQEAAIRATSPEGSSHDTVVLKLMAGN